VLIEVGGVEVLTDPVLRDRLGHLRRRSPSPTIGDVDVVLISHAHMDHLDRPSLRRLDPGAHVIAPAGLSDALDHFDSVAEVWAGDAVGVLGMRITAVPAEHEGGRHPLSGMAAEALGYVIECGGLRIYFAGDTDLFEGMAEAVGDIDVALLPVWGWGPSLGEGHMDPVVAAQAAALLMPRVAIPIHWGTLYPTGLARFRPDPLSDPPREFLSQCALLAPEVDVRVLAPGDSTSIA
jgi:L-ascorbate metabolism protein UlaG (beta-lactamase superfamily)